jgi:hypothetical protein
MPEWRRENPRIPIEALCWELVGGDETRGLAVDLSPVGLRLERPYTGGPTRHAVGLQIEVPGIDEVMWARADACFDVIVPGRGPAGGALGLVRRTGYRIIAAASRDLRMLKELVIETDRAHRRTLPPPPRPVAPPPVDLGLASCYLRA